MVQVHGVLWCAKIQNHTRTCGTHFGNTVGIPIPILNPTEGPSIKKIVTAKIVAGAINMCFKMAAWKGEEMKAPSLMEEEPQALPKWPKIQTAALE